MIDCWPASGRFFPSAMAGPMAPWLLLIALASPGPAAPQTVVNVGATVQVPLLSGSLGTLVMDGGTLAFYAQGQAQDISATDSILKRGFIRTDFSQGGVVLNLLGTTTVPGPRGSGTFPATGMYLGASPFDAHLDIVNRGTLIQSNNGYIDLLGGVRLVNGPSASYIIDSEDAMRATGDDALFLNLAGATLWNRRDSPFINSYLDVRIEQQGGTVKVSAGQFWLYRGGSHANATLIVEESVAQNRLSSLVLNGTHDFNTVETVSNGSRASMVLASGASINVNSVTWTQRGDFQANGLINVVSAAALLNRGSLRVETGLRIAAGGVLENHGVIEHGTVFGSGRLVNETAGRFESETLPEYDPRTNALLGALSVENLGTFVVGAQQSVYVNSFVNHAGILTVNGVLTNTGNGRLSLLGGVLNGNGTINGDVFVGGGSGVAQFRPGASPGTFVVNGDLSLLPGGEFDLEVQASGGYIFFDQIRVTGRLALNGRVNIIVGPGVSFADLAGIGLFDLQGGALIEYGSNFAWAFPGRPDSFLVATPQGLRILALGPLVAVPEPAVAAMLLLGWVAVWLAVTRGAGGAGGIQSPWNTGFCRAAKAW